MKEYATMPPAWRDDKAKTTAWVDKALAHASTLPPKEKKKKG